MIDKRFAKDFQDLQNSYNRHKTRSATDLQKMYKIFKSVTKDL